MTPSFAGLQPGSTGLYRVDAQVPFVVLTGPITVQVTVGGVATQANTTIQFRQLGFYYTLLGGVFPNGQTRNGISGANSALAYRQSDSGTWGANGFNTWTSTTPYSGSQFSVASGLALTLMNGASYVYDNNGIETGNNLGFYNNLGGPSDSLKAGFSDNYSNSNYFPLVFAGYFKLTAATQVTKIIGYFDMDASALVNLLPFDAANPYVKYRMNIYNSVTPGLPKENGTYVGDVFSSDVTAGTFAYSVTTTPMISNNPTKNGTRYPYRLTYTLANPITIPAGEYWFTHDAAVRQTPAATSTSEAPIVTAGQLQQMIRTSQKGRTAQKAVRFSLLGTEMTLEDAPSLPYPVVVRPSWPEQQQQ